ncbi:adenylate kinase [Clostridium chauvoei]|uniref:Adenylate kinase n=2 Tax=Clostridium chauvoei TaxID=46867 RepID=S6EPG0_9CLOT|nr:adenylate kinase [Clostridium chauvoei]ATD53958.1 adenylate kinase [Clostridium chauvoei]ATD58241.1 adenylate kinase [Clostridium chauvoei]MBX7280603.1 adenylate kinase [Clostridium chauvoei]MBX7283069.1 adenylate kinase [Clostridium chauvoei]MBX7285401.1 adenylate kinase [Clostridium chauvoei]
MKIVLLGPPGAGKGTQAKSISNRYSIPHISTGDIFRKNISENTPLGIEAKKHIDKGQLVPDEVTINMVKDRLQDEDCKGGYLLDGFPRTVAQAEALQQFLNERNEDIDTALLIEVPMEFILERMTGRRVCPSCGASYHIKFNPPTIAGKCDVCGSDVIQRKDDSEETVSERLDVYERQTQPLIDFYKERNLLSIVDGTKAINEVFEGICDILGSGK